MKERMSKVTEARKAAEANLITRWEETSANLSVLQSSRKALEQHHGQGLCSAFTGRSITASGEATIQTFLRNQYEKPAISREFLDILDILSTAAGSPPYYP